MTKIAILIAVLLCSMSTQAEVYRWVDKDGKVHYSDNPPADANAEQRKLQDNDAGGLEQNYETKRAAQLAPVTLYVSTDCKDYCDKARKLLSTRKVPIKESVVQTQEQIDALGALLGKKSPQAPTLVVGRKPIEGFEAGSWNSALDLAGYPKAP
jgi:glutaredoxin